MTMVLEAAFDEYRAGEIDVDGRVDERRGIRYFGKARRDFAGRWTAAAAIGGALCLVEIAVKPTIHVDHDPGDE